RVRRVHPPHPACLRAPHRGRRHRIPHRHDRPGRLHRGGDPRRGDRAARVRVLLGRDRLPARSHPPGRPAALGSTAITAAATVPLSSGLAGPELGEAADDHEITLTWAEFTREIRQAERTGLCAHPVRLKGRIDAIDLATGELRTIYSTTSERDGALVTACKNRRESVCPACSAVYKRDARQLVRA